MYYLFLFIMLSATGYFLFAKRVFDFFSIAIFSGFFYFFPAVFGYAYNSLSGTIDPLINEQYYIIIAYYVLFSMGAILKDKIYAQKQIFQAPISTTTMSNVVGNKQEKYFGIKIRSIILSFS